MDNKNLILTKDGYCQKGFDLKENTREIKIENYLEERKSLNTKDQSIFDYTYLTGVRVSEALEAKANDFFWEQKRVNVLTKKTREHRSVHLFPYDGPAQELFDNVKETANIVKAPTKIWLYEHRKEPRIYLWEQAKQTFGCTFHSFRHTHAIYLVRDLGLNQYELCSEMGWTDLNSSKYYVKYDTTKSIEKKMGITK